jgi:hypothetical protein
MPSIGRVLLGGWTYPSAVKIPTKSVRNKIATRSKLSKPG